MLNALRQLTPLQATLWLVVISSLLRVFTASSIGLSVDEAHYALYGLHLDWSYFDHPPMVGWVQAVMLQWGDSDRVLRLAAIVLFAASSLVLFRLCNVFFAQDSKWLGFFSVAVLHSAAMLQLLGLALLPEVPLLLFSLLTLLALHAALTSDSLRPWLWLGLFLGLAGLSKYTAITLAFSVVTVMAMRQQWSRFKTAGPWLALMVGLLCITPILYWNAQHDWISFSYQLHHGARNPDWSLGRVLRSELFQLIVFGPLMVVFGVISLVASWKERSQLGVLLCVATALPVLVLFGMGAGREVTLPHWTTLAWVALTPLAVRWVMQHWQQTWVRVTTWLSASYAVLLLVLMYGVFAYPAMLTSTRVKPLADLYGWQQGAQEAERLRKEMQLTAGTAPVLFVDNWTQASRLAWYARPAAVQVLDDRQDQFDLWFGQPKVGARGILLAWSPDLSADLPAVAARFDRCDKVGASSAFEQGQVMSRFTYYRCEGWHG